MTKPKPPQEDDLKRKIGAMLGTNVLAVSLVVVPVGVDGFPSHPAMSSAWAGEGGSGSGGSDPGDSGGSGESGESGSSGSGSSGESGESGAYDIGATGLGDRTKTPSIPRRFGHVVRSRISNQTIEVRYSDGWHERVAGGWYRLRDAAGRTVVERRARRSDFRRLRRAATAISRIDP